MLLWKNLPCRNDLFWIGLASGSWVFGFACKKRGSGGGGGGGGGGWEIGWTEGTKATSDAFLNEILI